MSTAYCGLCKAELGRTSPTNTARDILLAHRCSETVTVWTGTGKRTVVLEEKDHDDTEGGVASVSDLYRGEDDND